MQIISNHWIDTGAIFGQKAQKAMKKKNETAKYPAIMTGYFDKVQEISNSHPSSRVRFMLKVRYY